MKLLLAGIILLIAVNATASQEKEKGVMMGAGLHTCAEFAHLYRKTPELTENIHFVWAQGLMSGMNLVMHGLKRPRHDLNGWEMFDQKSHIRHFCEQNPLTEYAYAVQDLFKSLPEISAH